MRNTDYANYVRDLASLRMSDVALVGGKSASLGELIGNLASAGVRVPGGFATTAQAYRDFLADSGLDARIAARLATLDVDDVNAIALRKMYGFMRGSHLLVR